MAKNLFREATLKHGEHVLKSCPRCDRKTPHEVYVTSFTLNVRCIPCRRVGVIKEASC